MVVALLAGGTGGAKLACGMRDLVGVDLHVIANTADDIEIYDVHVSPDPDLISYRLAGAIDERGYGLAGDTFEQMKTLAAAGEPTWFELGDNDFAVCRKRAELLAAGTRLTEAHAAATAAFDTGGAQVLPMCDEPVRTEIMVEGAWRPLQQFLIQDRSEPTIEAVQFTGIEQAQPTPEVRNAILSADVVVVGPSNPIISIEPIVGIPGFKDLLADATAPVVVVSPLVGRSAIKGPTEAFMAAAGYSPALEGIVQAYDDFADGYVSDSIVLERVNLVTGMIMESAASARRLAAETLALGRELIERNSS